MTEEWVSGVTLQHKWLRLPLRQVATYNCWDTLATARVAKAIPDELRDNGQLDYYMEEVVPNLPVVLAMQRRGLQLDPEARNTLRKKLRRELRETDTLLRDRFAQTHPLDGLNDWLRTRLAEHNALDEKTRKRRRLITQAMWDKHVTPHLELNPNSDIQVGRWLYQDLGLKVGKTTEGGRPSVDQEALTRVLRDFRKKDEPHREVVNNLFHRSRLQTILERYMDIPVAPDGRVYPRIKMFGTETGRFAYADPAIQQYPKEARVIFTAAPGKVFVSADYSQLEARILAVLSNDTTSLAAFAEGRDIHSQNALDLFGPEACGLSGPPTVEWRAPDLNRNFAKTFLYKISYGGRDMTQGMKTYCPCPRCVHLVPQTVNLRPSEIDRASQRWFHKHSPVMTFRDTLAEECKTTHSYTTPLGRKRFFTSPWPAVERELYNFPMQATAADIINRAMRRLHYTYGAPLVLQMHDSLTLEVNEKEAPRWENILRMEMERPVPELNNTVFPVDVATGTHWSDL